MNYATQKASLHCSALHCCWTRGLGPSSTIPVFSARHGFGYGTLTLYHSNSYLLILWVKWWDKKTKLMHLRQTLFAKVDICAWWISTNVKVQDAWPWYNVSMCQAQHCAVQSALHCTILHCTLYIIPQPGYFYRGNICECSPCTDVYPCDWSVSMVHWYCLSVQLVTSLLRLIENTVFPTTQTRPCWEHWQCSTWGCAVLSSAWLGVQPTALQ